MRADRYLTPFRATINDSPSIGSSDGVMLLLDAIGERKTVLDLDGGADKLGRLLASRGCLVTPRAIAELDTKPLLSVVGDARFDVVFVADALQQLRDPGRVLEEARATLKQDGYVVATVPNAAHGALRLAMLEGRSTGQEPLRTFTARSLDELFLTAGYALSHVERVIIPLFQHSDHLPDISPELVSNELRAQIESDPEHDTLRFVVRAFPLSDEGRHRLLCRRFFASSAEAHDLRVTNLQRERRIESLRSDLAEARHFLANADAEMRIAQAHAGDIEQRLAAAITQLEEQASATNISRSECERLSAQIETLTRSAEQFEKAGRELEAERNRATREVAVLENELEVFAAANNDLLAREMRAQEERDATHAEQLQSLGQAVESERLLRAATERAAADLAAKYDTLERIDEKRKADLDTLAERLGTLERALLAERTAREEAETRVTEVTVAFQRHLDLALEHATAQAGELAAALDEIQQSTFWRLKRFLRRVILGER